jgi:hypothetical protein
MPFDDHPASKPMQWTPMQPVTIKEVNPIAPQHYDFPSGLMVIDLTQYLNFCRGNVVKYVCRAGKKPSACELEDLRKARWYLDWEIARLEKERRASAD